MNRNLRLRHRAWDSSPFSFLIPCFCQKSGVYQTFYPRIYKTFIRLLTKPVIFFNQIGNDLNFPNRP